MNVTGFNTTFKSKVFDEVKVKGQKKLILTSPILVVMSNCYECDRFQFDL